MIFLHKIEKMNYEEIKKRQKSINWYHTINLGNGIITKGIDNSPEKLKQLRLDDDFSGKTVLDVGAWDGFYSFEAEKRGAKRVLALDSFVWKETPFKKFGFEFARKVLNSKVEDIEMEIIDISPESIGVFDIIIFSGILYHMRHPLLILEKISKVTKEKLILETHVDALNIKKPAMIFYPGTDLAKDPTNWWGPNPLAVVSMLKDVGFSHVKEFENNTNPTRRIFHAYK